MSGHEWEVGLLVIGAVIAGFIQTIFRRAENTGKRIGKLESESDYRRGFEDGRRAGREEERKENAK